MYGLAGLCAMFSLESSAQGSVGYTIGFAAFMSLFWIMGLAEARQ
jgi:hypothetical protein